MSPGIRSGVNWTRLVSMSSAAGQRAHQQRLGDTGHALEQHVAAREQAMMRPETAASCPTTALATSGRTASSASRASSGETPAAPG